MNCLKCKSTKIATVSSKSGDLNSVTIPGFNDMSGHINSCLNIGGGDYVRFSFCTECGQIQGEFPLDLYELEAEDID